MKLTIIPHRTGLEKLSLNTNLFSNSEYGIILNALNSKFNYQLIHTKKIQYEYDPK